MQAVYVERWPQITDAWRSSITQQNVQVIDSRYARKQIRTVVVVYV